MIVDSGATHHMISNRLLFTTITIFPDSNRVVTLGDDKTKLTICGYGTIVFKLDNKPIRLFALYVPKLGTSLFSVKQHMTNQGCFMHFDEQNTVITFPNFLHDPEVNDEFELVITKYKPRKKFKSYEFDECYAKKCNIKQSHLFKQVTLESNISSPTHKVLIQKLIPEARLPKRSTPGSIGYDVYIFAQTNSPRSPIITYPALLFRILF